MDSFMLLSYHKKFLILSEAMGTSDWIIISMQGNLFQLLSVFQLFLAPHCL